MEIDLAIETIQRSIYLVRGQKVMLDLELAILYGVEPKTLARAVKRNLDRFPEDFRFQLLDQEWETLRNQIGNSGAWGGLRFAPHVFTEQGVAMLSSVLQSSHAIQVNIQILRAFVAIRQIIQAVPSGQRLATLEDASRLHGDRPETIETPLPAMEGHYQSDNITVQGDMIGNTLSLGAILDTLGAKASKMGFNAADGARFKTALQDARVNPPNTSRGRAALHTLKRMLESVAEHAGGAVVEPVVLDQLGRFLG